MAANRPRKADKTDVMLAQALAMGGGPAAVAEHFEQEGQRSVQVTAEAGRQPATLPRCDAATRGALTAAGVVFLREVPGDPLFQEVTLPAGWKTERTDHALWSRLVDEQGRNRASILYKAAFWDRDASMSATPRFVATDACDDYEVPDSLHVPTVYDQDRCVVWRGEPSRRTPVGFGKVSPQVAAARAVLHAACPRYGEIEAELQQLDAERRPVVNAIWAETLTDAERNDRLRAAVAQFDARQLVLDVERLSLYWDVTPAFPPSLSEAPVKHDYRVTCVIYRDGAVYDRSTETHQAVSDERIVEKIEKWGRDLADRYDAAQLTICRGEATLLDRRFERPRRVRRGYTYFE